MSECLGVTELPEGVGSSFVLMPSPFRLTFLTGLSVC